MTGYIQFNSKTNKEYFLQCLDTLRKSRMNNYPVKEMEHKLINEQSPLVPLLDHLARQIGTGEKNAHTYACVYIFVFVYMIL